MSTNRTPRPRRSPSLRSLLGRAALAGAGAGLTGLLVADASASAFDPTGAEPGFTAADAALAVLRYLVLLLATAGLTAWALLRLLRVPWAGRSALLALPLCLGYGALFLLVDEAGLIPDGAAALSGWDEWTIASMFLLPMACATASAVPLTGRLCGRAGPEG
ncbi:hypothetical protein J0910_03775 [Nocardiopsis sp. CNT-189]|uniref:hypothetical protein n=1 Tax=Nocardiopsis oceanisediminis TaxID=2816862 RepID=UPI003B382BE7